MGQNEKQRENLRQDGEKDKEEGQMRETEQMGFQDILPGVRPDQLKELDRLLCTRGHRRFIDGFVLGAVAMLIFCMAILTWGTK